MVKTATAAALSWALLVTATQGFTVPSAIDAPRTALSVSKETESPPISSEESSCLDESNLPPMIQQIVDERAEFQVNLGRAMDTLRRDMPEILSTAPDYSIYHDNISVIDPSGVQLTGLDNYKSALKFLQTFGNFWFRDTSIQYRMVYDFCRPSIRISWHAVLNPKMGGKSLRVDGISYYQLDAASGLINEHRLETLVINQRPAAPPYGILSLLQQDALGMMRPPAGIPAGVLGTNA